MSEIGQALSFAAGLYRQRASVALAGYLRREPMALLQLRPGRNDPYTIYDRLRQHGTMVPDPMGAWATTSYRVCNSLLRDRRWAVGPEYKVPRADFPPPDESITAIRPSLISMNPPDHTRLRRLVQPAFSPKAIAGYRPLMEATVGRLLDRAEAMGRFDLVSTVATPMPLSVITELLGVPEDRTKDLARYGHLIQEVLDGVRSIRHAVQLQEADEALTALFTDLFAQRRRDPGDDLTSRVVAAEGDQIKPDEMVPLLVIMLTGGFLTTANLINNAVNALLDHPDQWDALCADPEELTPRAIEETLRYDSPAQRVGRYATQPMELEGKPIAPDQRVVALIGAANRDPEVYPNPNQFDIHRGQTAEHLAFASGIHYCIGQPLAVLEATVALRCIAQRMPGLRRAGSSRRSNSTLIRGFVRLPVSVGSTR